MGKKNLKVMLIVLPFVLMLGAIPFVNRIHPIIIGLPFFHFWLLLGMILTPVCTFIIYQLDKSEGNIK
ncbi:DUF3311 domain-containing protein [Cytobacillus depressus]|uniref:DUF3311 domain-containing protein n=1 Tax=Cytobacillus depressus TaxID=1602942 RepID=A0A6L3V9W7_9BACI|nr:DUF3311 domain-containing protein [Cytobacillus depressus]KAB2336157.1 DUF3311 domain-containing protein [Cytobacillus depressus]